MQMSNGNLEALWRFFIHDTDSVAKTKDSVQSDTFMNTTTCWMKVSIEDQGTRCGSTMEGLHKTVGSNLANTADLIVLAGDTDVSAEAAANSALELTGDEQSGVSGGEHAAGRDEIVEYAVEELQQHLLKASNLSPPTMYAVPLFYYKRFCDVHVLCG
jgi:hypothetical protein